MGMVNYYSRFLPKYSEVSMPIVDLTRKNKQFVWGTEQQRAFETLKERIVAQGEKNKQKIIEDAKQESKMLLEGAKQKIDNQIIETRNVLKKELIDSAISIAMQRLPAEMTAEDNQKWVDRFLSSAGTE